MSLIALELPRNVAVELQRNEVIGAGGLTPQMPQVFECLLPDLEWPAVEAHLISQKVPFKVELPGAPERVPFNGASW